MIARTVAAGRRLRGWGKGGKALILLGFGALLACDHEMPADPLVGDVPEPLMDRHRVDATGDGDPHFYFMPPVARQLFPYRGVFEPRALPDLRVLVGRADQTPPSSDVELPVLVNKTHEFYEVRWDAHPGAYLNTVSVRLGDKQLGRMLMEAASTPAEEREIRGRGYGVFTPGTRVQIRFRVEVGAGEPATTSADAPRMSDARTPDADPRLLFTPPVAWGRGTNGPFVPDLQDDLIVEVWRTFNGELDRVVERFESGGGDPSRRVHQNRSREFYSAAWPTAEASPWVEYRARVLLAGEELGWVDVDVVPPGFWKPAGPFWVIPYEVEQGKAATIRFRIESAEVEPVDFETTPDGAPVPELPYRVAGDLTDWGISLRPGADIVDVTSTAPAGVSQNLGLLVEPGAEYELHFVHRPTWVRYTYPSRDLSVRAVGRNGETVWATFEERQTYTAQSGDQVTVTIAGVRWPNGISNLVVRSLSEDPTYLDDLTFPTPRRP